MFSECLTSQVVKDRIRSEIRDNMDSSRIHSPGLTFSFRSLLNQITEATFRELHTIFLTHSKLTSVKMSRSFSLSVAF